VTDFGVELLFTPTTVTARQVRPSIATYPDGERRYWQESGNPTQKLKRWPKQ
jgi:hypothetical protein